MKVMVLSGGGIDSATCVGYAVKEFGAKNTLALTFKYGQKHDTEVEYVKKLAGYYGIKNMVLDLISLYEKDARCALLKKNDVSVEHDSYENQALLEDGAPIKTCVPFRMGVFLSVATSQAIMQRYDLIVHGTNLQSMIKNTYPDASSIFCTAMGEAAVIGSGGLVRTFTPFLDDTKAGVIKYGTKIGVPYELTWSCYEGRKEACGTCGACIERKLAFIENGLEDPIEYENKKEN